MDEAMDGQNKEAIKSQIAALQAELATLEKAALETAQVTAATASTSAQTPASPVAARLMSGPLPNTPPSETASSPHTVTLRPAEPAKKSAGSSTPATPAITSVQLVKPGVKTTEFWLTVATDIAATVLLLTHRMTTTEWTTLTGGTAALYATARTWIKG